MKCSIAGGTGGSSTRSPARPRRSPARPRRSPEAAPPRSPARAPRPPAGARRPQGPAAPRPPPAPPSLLAQERIHRTPVLRAVPLLGERPSLEPRQRRRAAPRAPCAGTLLHGRDRRRAGPRRCGSTCAIARLRAAPVGTTSLTRPMRSASAASIFSAVKRRRAASSGPTRSHEPRQPAPGRARGPSSTWRNASEACSSTMTKSQSSNSSQPPPQRVALHRRDHGHSRSLADREALEQSEDARRPPRSPAAPRGARGCRRPPRRRRSPVAGDARRRARAGRRAARRHRLAEAARQVAVDGVPALGAIDASAPPRRRPPRPAGSREALRAPFRR